MTGKQVAEWFDKWSRAAGYYYLSVVLMDYYGYRMDMIMQPKERSW